MVCATSRPQCMGSRASHHHHPSHPSAYCPPQVLNDEHWEKLRSFTPKLLPYTSTEKLQQVRGLT